MGTAALARADPVAAGTRPAFVLGIETSGPDTGVALTRGDDVVFESVARAAAGHNENLLPLLRGALAAAGLAPSGLGGIGVTIGPGMFTSLRVGLAAAKGLAEAGAVPLEGIGTLDALAAAAGSGPVLALVDARKQEVYASLYQDGSARLGPAVVAIRELGSWLAGAVPPGTRLVLAGSGTPLCAGALTRPQFDCCESGIVNPPPRVVARLAARAIARSGGSDVSRLEPVYLRRTDAELRRAGG